MILCYAIIYVHWTEVEADGNVFYHQNIVDSWNLKKKWETNSLRQTVYNVPDWGLFERKEIIDTCAKILDLYQRRADEGSPLKKQRALPLWTSRIEVDLKGWLQLFLPRRA